MLRSAVVPGALLIGVSLATAAERPPQLNVAPSCNVAAGAVSDRTRESCMTDENTARRALDEHIRTLWGIVLCAERRRQLELGADQVEAVLEEQLQRAHGVELAPEDLDRVECSIDVCEREQGNDDMRTEPDEPQPGRFSNAI